MSGTGPVTAAPQRLDGDESFAAELAAGYSLQEPSVFGVLRRL
jgi:hypothetical protein